MFYFNLVSISVTRPLCMMYTSKVKKIPYEKKLMHESNTKFSTNLQIFQVREILKHMIIRFCLFWTEAGFSYLRERQPQAETSNQC